MGYSCNEATAVAIKAKPQKNWEFSLQTTCSSFDSTPKSACLCSVSRGSSFHALLRIYMYYSQKDEFAKAFTPSYDFYSVLAHCLSPLSLLGSAARSTVLPVCILNFLQAIFSTTPQGSFQGATVILWPLYLKPSSRQKLPITYRCISSKWIAKLFGT